GAAPPSRRDSRWVLNLHPNPLRRPMHAPSCRLSVSSIRVRSSLLTAQPLPPLQTQFLLASANLPPPLPRPSESSRIRRLSCGNTDHRGAPTTLQFPLPVFET